MPTPWHSAQAPNGELNENWRGSSSGKRESADRTGEALGEDIVLWPPGWRTTSTIAVGGAQRRLDRIGEPGAILGLDDQAVDHDRDVVVLAAVQRRNLAEIVGRAIDAHPDVALLAEIVEQLLELALAAAHHRAEHLDARPLRPGQHRVGDLRRRSTG